MKLTINKDADIYDLRDVKTGVFSDFSVSKKARTAQRNPSWRPRRTEWVARCL